MLLCLRPAQGYAIAAVSCSTRFQAHRVKTNMARSQTAYMNKLGVLGHPIVLRHPAISEQLSVVSRLLCTSKTVAAALSSHAAGLLVLNLRCRPIITEVVKLNWLSRNSSLVKSLTLSFMPCRSSAHVHQLAYLCDRYSNILHSLEVETSPEDTDTVKQLAAVVSEHGAKLSTFRIGLTEDPDELMLWEQLLADAMQQAATTAAGFNSKPCLGGLHYAQPPGRLPVPTAEQQQQPGELIAGQTATGTAESDLDFPRLPQLQSFGTFFQVGAALLEHLPATLTELSFEDVFNMSDEDVIQMKAALGRLSNLQSLRIHEPDSGNVSSVVARLPVHSLTSLTMLELNHLLDVSFAAMLPAALKRLEFTTERNAVASPLEIGHLTQLTHLDYGTTDVESPGIMLGSSLPASLKQLYCIDIALNVLTDLTNLRKLSLRGCTIPGSNFADVAESLTQLEEVKLMYQSERPMTHQTSLDSDIVGWSEIPLTRLDLSLGGYLYTDSGLHHCQKCDQQQLAAGLGNLGRLQTLTTLWLTGSYPMAQKPQIDTEVLVGSLSKLSLLCFLGLQRVTLTGGDVALTRLSEAIDCMPNNCRLDMHDVDTGAAASGSTKRYRFGFVVLLTLLTVLTLVVTHVWRCWSDSVIYLFGSSCLQNLIDA